MIAVDLFFVLSGYLITHSYLRINNIIAFLMFRILRLFPALWVLVLFTAFIVGPIVAKYGSHTTYIEYFNNHLFVGYLNNMSLYNIRYLLPWFNSKADVIYSTAVNGSLWTLPLEFSCYILVALFGIILEFLFMGSLLLGFYC